MITSQTSLVTMQLVKLKCRNAGGGTRCTAVRDMISAYWQVHWPISARWNTMTALPSDRNAAVPFAQTQSYTAAEHLSCSLCCLCSCVCAVTSWWPTHTHSLTVSVNDVMSMVTHLTKHLQGHLHSIKACIIHSFTSVLPRTTKLCHKSVKKKWHISSLFLSCSKGLQQFITESIS